MRRAPVRCAGCGSVTPSALQEDMPEHGWVLPYEDFGYYAGFTDNIDMLTEDRPSKTAPLCHDCVVKVLEVLPLLAAKIDQGVQHPYTGDVPCCPWGWKA